METKTIELDNNERKCLSLGLKYLEEVVEKEITSELIYKDMKNLIMDLRIKLSPVYDRNNKQINLYKI